MPGGEGLPITIPEVCVLEEDWRKMGNVESADRIHVGVDCYLRSQDMDGLQGQDVSIVGDRAALALGVIGRGESKKGGPRQGVLVDFPSTVSILRRRKLQAGPFGKIFPGGGSKFSADWRKEFDKRGWLYRPPHAVRHALPS